MQAAGTLLRLESMTYNTYSYAGCSAIVIEFVPEMLGQEITKALNIPTFGIGAGRFTRYDTICMNDSWLIFAQWPSACVP